MSNLKSTEKIKLEKLFEMGSGYVCNFSDRTFGEFVEENTGVNVYTDEYAEGGTSKANRLRTFWKKESNYLVSKLLAEMIEYWKTQKITSSIGAGISPTEQILFEECEKIVERLKNDNFIENIDQLKPNSQDKDFSVLTESIKEDLKKNRHEYALDRLHTFVVKYISELCNKHKISYQKGSPLHSIFGTYVKYLKDKNLIESDMSLNILKSSIKILDDFNSVRNNKSFAHDNKAINHAEGVLIVNNIIHSIFFIEALEQVISEREKRNAKDEAFSQEEIDEAVDLYEDMLHDIAMGK